MNIADKIAAELHIQPWQAEAVIRLIDEGNTIPFTAVLLMLNIILPTAMADSTADFTNRGTGEDDEGAVQGN